MATKVFIHRDMKECVSCGQTMFGVYSYEVRDVCTPCGGKSKCENEDEKPKGKQQRFS